MFSLVGARSLFYVEKTLDDFDVDSEDSIFSAFFNIMLDLEGLHTANDGVEQNISDLFNDACYICTLVLIIKRPVLKLGNIKDFCKRKTLNLLYRNVLVEREDIVLCMVFFMLKHYDVANGGIIKFLSALETSLKEGAFACYDLFCGFRDAVNNSERKIPANFFDQKRLAFDEFDWAESMPDWKYLTGNYNKTNLHEIINCWKDPEQRDIVIDDIISEVTSDYFNTPLDEQPLIIYPCESRRCILELVESLSLTGKQAKKREQSETQGEKEVKETGNRLNDPKIYSWQIPFLIYDENNETIISRTAKKLNNGELNPYETNWMEVTLYDSFFVKQLLECIHSEYLMDVAQAIDDEEARHAKEDGQYTDIASNFYGTGQGSDKFYSRMQDNYAENNTQSVTIAEGILKNRKKAEEFQKRLEHNSHNTSVEKTGSTKSKGRPRSPNLEKCFREGVDAKVYIERMRPLLKGKVGRDVALVITAVDKLGVFETIPNYTQLEREFGKLGESSGYRQQMKHLKLRPNELERMVKKLK